MQAIVLSITVGLIAGHTLAFPILIIITGLCFWIGITLSLIALKEGMDLRDTKGEIKLRPVKRPWIYGILMGTVVMWTIFYVETNQTWVGDTVHNYVLRYR
jgi:hypothetical protein